MKLALPAYLLAAVIGGGHIDVGVRWIFHPSLQELGAVDFLCIGTIKHRTLELGAAGVFRFERSAVY